MYDHKVLPDMAGIRPESAISLVRFDPAKEMDILRTVVLRDALISLLVEQRRTFMSGGALCLKTVLCALLETREASLDVIDAIRRWRLTLVKPEPFNVRGKNYAVEMTTDVGFLATGLAPLREAFGLEIGTGNTFALPCTPSLNAAAARDSGVGNGRTHKDRAGSKVAKARGNDMTADLAATGRKAAPDGRARVPDKSKTKAKQAVLAAAPGGTAGDSKPGGGSDTAADEGAKGGDNTEKQPAVSATAAVAAEGNQIGVERPGSALIGDDAAQVEGEARPCKPDEEDPPNIKNADHEGAGVNGRGVGRSASVQKALCLLGDVDDEQRARLARAQRFLEEEVARQDVVSEYHSRARRPYK
eukprot:g6420.t1